MFTFLATTTGLVVMLVATIVFVFLSIVSGFLGISSLDRNGMLAGGLGYILLYLLAGVASIGASISIVLNIVVFVRGH
jgi:hypothetical protein